MKSLDSQGSQIVMASSEDGKNQGVQAFVSLYLVLYLDLAKSRLHSRKQLSWIMGFYQLPYIIVTIPKGSRSLDHLFLWKNDSSFCLSQ